MGYTVKQLSDLSGVTIRTLHYYEEINLLKPAYYGSNGYRYYEEKELLLLQQILFFKEMGLTLKQISKVIGKSDFDQLNALYSHKQALSKELEKIGRLLKTVDRTIKHLKGKKKMKDQEMFDGFNITLVEGEAPNIEIVVRSVRNPTKNSEDVAKRGKSFYDAILQTAHGIFEELVNCIHKGLDPSSGEVQKIIKKHHAFIDETMHATKEVYTALAHLYRDHPAFRKQLDPYHPQLAAYMAQGMQLYASRELE